jgi:hypothetical protein
MRMAELQREQEFKLAEHAMRMAKVNQPAPVGTMQ